MSNSLSIYDANAVEQVAINLFHGWGYNFYRLENQLRADDQMVRAKVSGMLGAARASVAAAETAYRREFIPTPSRERPRPDPEAVLKAQLIESLARDIGSVEGLIRALPTPENDRMTQRYRKEAETLTRLASMDQKMVGHAEVLRTTLAGKAGPWLVENIAQVHEHISAIRQVMQERGDLLH